MNAAVWVVCVREMQTASTVRAVISVNVLMAISSHLMEPALVRHHYIIHYQTLHWILYTSFGDVEMDPSSDISQWFEAQALRLDFRS